MIDAPVMISTRVRISNQSLPANPGSAIWGDGEKREEMP